MNDCKGCESGGKCEHDIQCLADSYMTFTGVWGLPEDVRDKIKAAFVAGFEWREQPTAMGESCSACGKLGKIFGEVLDDKDEHIKHPLCGKCCQMWDDVDTKDDVWSAICVRRNSGAYVVISPPPEVKP